METMIDLGMYLPATFVKDMCWKCEVAVEVRYNMLINTPWVSMTGFSCRPLPTSAYTNSSTKGEGLYICYSPREQSITIF